MQVAMSEVLVLLFPLSQWLWCHIPWFLIRGKPHPCPSSFMDGQISSLSLSLPQPHPRTKYFSDGSMDSLYRAVGWGLSTGSKEDTHSRNWSSFPRKSFSFTHWGHRGSFAFSFGLCFKAWRKGLDSSSCSSFPVQCPDGNGAAGFGRKGWECAKSLPKGISRINPLVHKTVRSKVPSGTVTWDKLKEKPTFFFFWVSTHLFSSSSFVKKNKMFNS